MASHMPLKTGRRKKSTSYRLMLILASFKDALSDREAARLGELPSVHEARAPVEAREEAMRFNTHDGICKSLFNLQFRDQ